MDERVNVSLDVTDPGFHAAHMDEGGGWVPRHAIDGLPELTAAIERLTAAVGPSPTAPAWPQPTRFDPDDRSTWPEDGQRVLMWGAGRWSYDEWLTADFGFPSTGAGWRRDFDGIHDQLHAEAGDLWLPLPPTPEVQG